jgi:hypothetical protein
VKGPFLLFITRLAVTHRQRGAVQQITLHFASCRKIDIRILLCLVTAYKCCAVRNLVVKLRRTQDFLCIFLDKLPSMVTNSTENPLNNITQGLFKISPNYKCFDSTRRHIFHRTNTLFIARQISVDKIVNKTF